MASCVERLSHSCGSDKGLQVFEEDGKYTGYCFSCNTYVPNPYEDKPEGYKPKKVRKSKEDIEREISEIKEYPILALKDRKLKKSTLEYFDIRIGVSQEDGETPILHYYPYYKGSDLMGYKARLIENKRMWSIGDCTDVDFFGWDQAVAAGGKKIFITEGELDAASLYQICKDANAGTRYAEFEPAVVSIPHGAAQAAKFIAKKLTDIRKIFKEIVLVFDMDEAGKKAVEEVLKIVPDAKVANLPEKDVNDCLVKGKTKSAYQAVQFNADKPKNTRLVSGVELHEVAKEPAKWGFSWPWKHITELTRGIRLGETIYIGAGQKQGKSEIVNTLAAHCMTVHGWKVFLVKPEEANKKTYKLVLGKIAGKNFNDPTVEFDQEAYDKAGEQVKDKMYMLNLYQHVGWETLKADIRSAAAEGCKAVFIDPITNLTNGMDAAAANTKLQEIAQELSAMALDLDIVIFIFCHLRNPDSGPPHERGGEVLSSQFAGSRAMARSCNLMIGLEGNRDPNLTPEERNIRHLVVLENRENGEVGRFGLYWNKNTTLFSEIK